MNIALAILLLVLLLLAGRWVYHRQRRKNLLKTPLPPDHKAIIAKAVPLSSRLPPALRTRFEGLINLFLDQVTFIGCDGLEVTDEMRVVIAAQASILVLSKENRWYKTLRTIMLYPDAFTSKQTSHDGHVETAKNQARLGESWQRGPIVLSWKHSAYGAFLDTDGHNVVMHEFAHQLDEQTGVTDGAPLLDRDHKASDWAKAFQDAFARHKKSTAKGRKTTIDPYGATNPAEFFAVVVETFFEQPENLKEDEPEIYTQLAKYFQLDPVRWK